MNDYLINFLISGIAGALMYTVFQKNWWKVLPFWIAALVLGMYLGGDN